MADLELKLACWDYDRTRPLIDGRVKPEGIKLDIAEYRRPDPACAACGPAATLRDLSGHAMPAAPACAI